jgi:hypothetical protein
MRFDEASNIHGRGTYTNFGRKKSEEKIPFGRYALRRKDEKAIYDTKVENECMDWTHLAQDVGQ